MAGLSLEARRLLLIQLALTGVLAVGFGLLGSVESAMAAAFGGAIAMGNAWLMGRIVARAMEVARTNPGSETTVLFIGAVQRFALVATLFAVGIGVLRLPPVELIVGFAVVHGTFFLARAIVAMPAPGASRDS